MTKHVSKSNDVLDELQQRWLDGDRVAVETLVREHPQVAQNSSVMLDLIYAEVLLREDHGQKAVESEYVERFPELSEGIARQFQLHRALQDSALGMDASTFSDAVTLSDPATSATPAVPSDYRLPASKLRKICGRVVAVLQTAILVHSRLKTEFIGV